MNTEVVIALVGAIGAISAAAVTWLVARRKNSGNISSSDAAMLWAESNALRAEYKDRAEKLEAQLQEVNAKLSTVTTELNKLQGKSSQMIKKIDELKGIIAKLRRENELLLKQSKHGQTGVSTA